MADASDDPRYLIVSNMLVTIRIGDRLGEGEIPKWFGALEELTKSSTKNGQTSSEVSALLLETAIAFSNARDSHDEDVSDIWELAFAESMDRIIAILTD